MLFFTIFTTAHAAVVRFYDDNLTLIETKSLESDSEFNFTTVKLIDNNTSWHLAGASIPLNTHIITKDINVYSAPLVKEITSEKELGEARNFLNGRYILLSDINLTKEWTPIGTLENPFTGVFNGSGYKINGLWFNNSDMKCVGLFGRTSGSLIRDVEVNTDAKKGGIFGKSHVGAIAGSAIDTVIINSHSNGFVRGGNAVGGIAGHAIGSDIKDSYSTCDIESYDDAGGIVGHAVGKIFQNNIEENDSIYENVHFSGTISLKESYAEYGKQSSILGRRGVSGGIVGYSAGITVINSYFSGSIEGADWTGGIAGYTDGGKILNTYSKGKIAGDKDIGGVVGLQGSCIMGSYSEADVIGKINVGGISGSLQGRMISNSYFAGNVKGESSVGGIAGQSIKGFITNGYSNGAVVGNTAVGGVTGKLSEDSFLRNSYSSATVNGKESVGGIAGESSLSRISDVYFIGSVKGAGKYTGGIVGYNVGLLSSSYVLGSVEGIGYAGGIAGYTKGESLIYNHSEDREEFIPAVSNNLAANSLIKGVNTARIAAVIDGEQKSVPHNFALSALNKGFTNFSEGDARNGISKTAEELKKEETYSTAPPEGLGWIFWNDVKNKYKDGFDYPWIMDNSTASYPVLYWQIIKINDYDDYCFDYE
jgi:hypothetical protein